VAQGVCSGADAEYAASVLGPLLDYADVGVSEAESVHASASARNNQNIQTVQNSPGDVAAGYVFYADAGIQLGRGKGFGHIGVAASKTVQHSYPQGRGRGVFGCAGKCAQDGGKQNNESLGHIVEVYNSKIHLYL
jgi:hypothetical protein